jgi:hypothetical protein
MCHTFSTKRFTSCSYQYRRTLVYYGSESLNRTYLLSIQITLEMGNGYIHRIYLANRDFRHLADILLSDTDHCATYVHMCAVFTEVAGSHTSKATKRF